MNIVQLYIFLACTIFIILFSWFVSLKEKRYHGIPRFFAFEGLLLLGLVQQPVWFNDPWAPWHIVSWILLTICTYYIFAAIFFYFRHAAPGKNFENSTKLVTTGIYKYIRHPMYSSLLILGWGMFFKAFTPVSIALICIITIAIYFTCIIEEKEMTVRFGDEYKAYIKRTKRWIPFFF